MQTAITRWQPIDPLQRKFFLCAIIANSKDALPSWCYDGLTVDFSATFQILENAIWRIVSGEYPLPVAVQETVEDADSNSSATDIDTELAGLIVQVGLFNDVIL